VVPYEPCAVAETVTLGDAMATDDEPRTSDAMIALMFMADFLCMKPASFERG
jgi:hypothetical protein